MRLTPEMLRWGLQGPLTGAQQRGRFDATDIDEWWQPLDDATARGQLLATIQIFIVTGTVAT